MDPSRPSWLSIIYFWQLTIVGLGLMYLVACDDFDKSIDLSGLWGEEGGGVMEITQQRNKVTSKFKQIPNNNPKGFELGEDSFYGTISENSLKGKIKSHFSMRNKHCSGWAYWNDLELNISEDRNSLRGRWYSRGTMKEDCSIDESKAKWKEVTFSRIVQPLALGVTFVQEDVFGREFIPVSELGPDRNFLVEVLFESPPGKSDTVLLRVGDRETAVAIYRSLEDRLLFRSAQLNIKDLLPVGSKTSRKDTLLMRYRTLSKSIPFIGDRQIKSISFMQFESYLIDGGRFGKEARGNFKKTEKLRTSLPPESIYIQVEACGAEYNPGFQVQLQTQRSSKLLPVYLYVKLPNGCVLYNTFSIGLKVGECDIDPGSSYINAYVGEKVKAIVLDKIAEAPVRFLTNEKPLPFSADQFRFYITELRKQFTTLLDISGKVPEAYPRLFSPELEKAFEYRINLIDNYLKIDRLYQKKIPVKKPGPDEATFQPEKKPLTELELHSIANVYTGLLEDKALAITGQFMTELFWPDLTSSRSNSNIYFLTAHEENMVASTLARCVMNTFRRPRMRRTGMAAAEGIVHGPRAIIPGYGITINLQLLFSGEHFDGSTASLADRLFSLADIGTEFLPIALGVLQARNAANNRVKDPLYEHFTNRSNWNQLLRAARTKGPPQLQEQIMTAWLDDYYRWSGVNARTMQDAAGRGIDMRVINQRNNIMILDELKQMGKFRGNWADRDFLRKFGNVTDIRLPGADGRVASQASLSWYLDRAIKKYNAAKLTGNVSEMAEARLIVEKFSQNKFKRRILVMNEEAQVFILYEKDMNFLMEANFKEGIEANFEQLRGIANKWLADNPPR